MLLHSAETEEMGIISCHQDDFLYAVPPTNLESLTQIVYMVIDVAIKLSSHTINNMLLIG